MGNNFEYCERLKISRVQKKILVEIYLKVLHQPSSFSLFKSFIILNQSLLIRYDFHTQQKENHKKNNNININGSVNTIIIWNRPRPMLGVCCVFKILYPVWPLLVIFCESLMMMGIHCTQQFRFGVDFIPFFFIYFDYLIL